MEDEHAELAKLVGAAEQEWRSFREGRALSTSLLLKLLSYKYRKQEQTIRVNPQTQLVNKEGGLLVPKPLSSSSLPLQYELILVVYLYAEVPTVALMIRTHSYPFTIFSPVSVVEMANPLLNYIANESLRDELSTNNGYFVFDFLTLFFKEGDNGAGWNNRVPMRTTARELADAMMEDLERPLFLKRDLVSLYREMGCLLGQKMTNDMRRSVESKKQAFYRLVEGVISRRHLDEEEEAEEAEEEEAFFYLPQLNELDPVEVPSTASNRDLLQELLLLLEFVLLVADTSSQASPAPRLRIKRTGNSKYTVADVKSHARHLVQRLLMQVDALNVPPLDDLMTHKLHFSQKDYDLLVGPKPFITYNIMAYALLPTLDPQAVLLGPRHAQMALNNNLVIRQQRRLTLWVMEGRAVSGEQYYSLTVLNQPPDVRCKRSIYMPSKDQVEMAQIRDLSTKVLKQVGLSCARNQIDGTYDEATDPYYFTSWYVAFLISSLSDRLGTESIDSDWISQVRLILADASLDALTEHTKSITRRVQRRILSLLYPASSSSQEQEEAEKPRLAPKKKPLNSRVSDVARLSLREEFIDDQVIRDMVASMPLSRRCYVFDPNYWGGVLVGRSPEEVLRVFKEPAIDTLLLPVNQLNSQGKGYHWSLATIDLSSSLVTFYSSLCATGDPYYEKFQPLIRRFLAVQTPGVKYTISHLQGQEIQPKGSQDCALFVLDKISELCMPFVQRVTYTRESVSAYLKKELVRLAFQGKWAFFAEDLCFLYVNKPAVWEDLVDDPTLLNRYRDQYLRLFVRIIAKTGLYDPDSVKALGIAIGRLKACTSGTEIESLFSKLLKKKEEKVSSSSSKKRRYSQQENTKEKGEKTRKCLVYDPRTLTLIEVLISQLNWFWNLYRGRSGQFQSFSETYGQTISDLYLQELVADKERRQAFLDALINTLLTKGGSRDALEPIICEYVSQNQVERALQASLFLLSKNRAK